MLEDLDKIDWNSLTHAYGEAGDVPNLLRARASSDPETAASAESELFGNIWHQGTVYSATAYAVPFIIELLTSERTVDRVGIVALLAAIADGHSYLEVHGKLRHYDNKRDTAEFQAKLQQELRWKRNAHEAVAKHADLYWRLLDEEPSLSVCVPYLLAAIPATRRDVCARLPGRIGTEAYPLARASALLAYSLACAGTDEGVRLFASLLDDADRWISFAAAHGLVVSGCVTDTLRKALDLLMNPVRDYEAYVGPEDWLWGIGDTQSIALEALGDLDRSQVPVLLRWLPELLSQLDKYGASSVAVECFSYMFRAQGLPCVKEDLTTLQLCVLRALARDTNVLHTDELIVSVAKSLVGDSDMKKLADYLKP